MAIEIERPHSQQKNPIKTPPEASSQNGESTKKLPKKGIIFPSNPVKTLMSGAETFFGEFALDEMDPETRKLFELPIEEPKPSRGQRLKRKAKQKLGTILSKPFMSLGVTPILNSVDRKWMPSIFPDIPINFKDSLIEKMKNPKALPIIIANHYDHANGIEMMVMSKTVLGIINANRTSENQFKGSRLIIAKSLKDGLQTAFLQSIIELAEKKYFSKYDVSTLASVSKNDQTRRNMNISENIPFMKELTRMAKVKDEMLELFVEGTVDGGRFTEGERNGMRPLIPELDQIFEILTRNNAELVFIPYGSHGPNRIHTDKKFPTKAAIKSLFLDRNHKNLVDIKVGMPISLTEIRQTIQEETGHIATSEDVRDYLGRRCIAPLLPPDYQGVFREK